MESRGELICELEVFSNFHSLVVGICEFYPGLDELWHTAITYRPEPSVCYPQASWQVLGCHCFFPCTSSGTNSRKDILSEQIREALTAHSVASLGGSRFLPEIKNTLGITRGEENSSSLRGEGMGLWWRLDDLKTAVCLAHSDEDLVFFTMGGGIMAPQGGPVLIPGTYDNVTLRGKRHFWRCDYA